MKSRAFKRDESRPFLVNGRFRVHAISGVQRVAHEIAIRLGSDVEVCAPRAAKGLSGHLWEQTILARQARGRVLWSPCGSGPLAYSPHVVTFHDLFPLEFPEFYSSSYARWYSFAMKRLARNAAHLIAVSEYTKSRIVALLGRDAESITVVPNGCHLSGPATTEQISRAREDLRIPSGRYFLSLSSLEKRKNLCTLLEAWKRIQSALPPDVWLVLAGPRAEASVYGKQNIPIDLPRVHFTGYVPEEHLAGLYSGAWTFVFPSLAEGFGLPLIEAMACGARCVSSSRGALPEVGGDAVEYVDPLDIDQLAKVLIRRLDLKTETMTPFAPAIERARSFTWDSAGAKTRAVLEAVQTRACASRSVKTCTGARRDPTPVVRCQLARSTMKSDIARVALVHDWLTGMRGGEKVLELLCQAFPNAPLWTLLYLPGTVSGDITNRSIRTSMLQRMPFAKDRYRNYLPLFPLFAETHKARAGDLVISTSHAVAKAMVRRRRKGDPYHICYIHTPMRYAWDLFETYFGPDRVGRLASTLFFRPLVQYLRWYDRCTARRVDLFLSNSSYIADRVKRIYGRDAIVLAPPVDTHRFSSIRREPEDWYIVVSALVPYKRVDHAIHACSCLKRQLKIVGRGPEMERLTELATSLGANVEFLGFVSDERVAELYGRARALLFPGIEDFGIVPVEALAAGCPVIALGEGGVLDSLTEKTGVLYHRPTEEGLVDAILHFESNQNRFNESALRARAADFSEARFLEHFERILRQVPGYVVAAGPEPDTGFSAAPQQFSTEVARPH